MNGIFIVILLSSITILAIKNPSSILLAMQQGGEKALALTMQMTVIYAVWLGILNLIKETGLDKKIARLLSPLSKFLFGSASEESKSLAFLNLSANMLGMGGAGTPLAVKSIEKMEEKKNHYKSVCMLFVLNATSVQLIPSSVISLRSSFGSISSADILLPTFLSTLCSTIIGVTLVKIFIKDK